MAALAADLAIEEPDPFVEQICWFQLGLGDATATIPFRRGMPPITAGCVAPHIIGDRPIMA